MDLKKGFFILIFVCFYINFINKNYIVLKKILKYKFLLWYLFRLIWVFVEFFDIFVVLFLKFK